MTEYRVIQTTAELEGEFQERIAEAVEAGFTPITNTFQVAGDQAAGFHFFMLATKEGGAE